MSYKISGFSDEIDKRVEKQFEHLNALGIEYFEPRGIDGKNISELDSYEAAELKRKMDKYGIKVSSIGSPIGKINISNDFEPHFEVFKNVVNIAKLLGTKYIRVFSFYPADGAWTDDTRAEVMERLNKMLDYAKSEDVILLHENEKDIYGDTTERCLDLMENLYCDNFKAVFDPANFVQCGQDTKDAYEKLRNYIEYMHIKDAKFSDGSVVPAGMGDGNVEYILSRLIEGGYDGFLSLEPHLGSFTGLAALETDDKLTKLEKSSAEKFTLAYDSLKAILERI